MTKKRGRSDLVEAETSPLSAVATRKLAIAGVKQNKDGQSKINPEAYPAKQPAIKELSDQEVPPSLGTRIKCLIDEPSMKRPITGIYHFTSFHIPDAQVHSQDEGELILRLRPGNKLVIMGEFSTLVSSGLFSIMGATLRGGAHVTVSAPLCHSLPVIECLSTEPSGVAEIKIQHHNSGMRSLHRAVPLFKHLWGGDPKISLDKQRSFTTLRSSNDIPGHWKYEVKTLGISESWKQLICTLAKSIKKEAPPVIVVAGPKSAGKSAFCRHLYNSMLTNPMLNGNNDGVAFLDLDPGQPESTPPGQVSLFHLQSPLLGPPFSHAGLINDNCLVRSHHIGYSTPEHNPDHYVACALNLFAQYRKLVPHHPACPLVINTAGWVKAVGLEILIDLLRQSFATHLVWFMSESEPLAGREDLASLRRASEGITVHELPLQPTRPTSRTPADLRAMQTLSYLHLSPGLNADSGQDGHGLQWDATPLTHQIPWVVEYSGPTPGILGIVILDEALPIELLATAINGTVVAVVVIEDDDAFPTTDGDQKATGTTSNEKGKQRPRDLTTIDYDPATKLPYIHTPNGAPLDPTKTSCAGLALIRGIDTASQTLHLITPVNPSSLPPDKNIVLVRGRTELSVMAYVEGGMEADMPYLSFEKTKHGNPTIRTKPSG